MLHSQTSDPVNQSTLRSLEQADLLILDKQPLVADNLGPEPEMPGSIADSTVNR